MDKVTITLGDGIQVELPKPVNLTEIQRAGNVWEADGLICFYDRGSETGGILVNGIWKQVQPVGRREFDHVVEVLRGRQRQQDTSSEQDGQSTKNTVPPDRKLH